MNADDVTREPGEKAVAAMKCEDIQALLTDYMTRELGESQSALVREHLRMCPVCQNAAREITEAFDLLHVARKVGAGRPDRLSDERRARIRRASSGSPPSSRPKPTCCGFSRLTMATPA